DLAERATGLLGQATTGTHPGLHAQLSLAECDLVAGDHDEAAARLGPPPAPPPGPPPRLAGAGCALAPGAHDGAAARLERAGAQLARPFGYRWRVELRHAELTSRLAPPAAQGVLPRARTAG